MEKKDKPAKGKKSPKPGATPINPEDLAEALGKEHQKALERMSAIALAIHNPLYEGLGNLYASIERLKAKAIEQITAYNAAHRISCLEGYLKAKGLILPALPEDLDSMAVWFWQSYHKFEYSETKALPAFDDLALHRFCEYLTERHELRLSLTKDETEPVDPEALENVVDMIQFDKSQKEKGLSSQASKPSVRQFAIITYFMQAGGYWKEFGGQEETKQNQIKAHAEQNGFSHKSFRNKWYEIEIKKVKANLPISRIPRHFQKDKAVVSHALMEYPKALLEFEKYQSR